MWKRRGSISNKLNIFEEPSSHTSDFSLGSKRKQHMCSKSSRIFVPENKRNVEIENDLHYK